jgi:hypothetical protein
VSRPAVQRRSVSIALVILALAGCAYEPFPPFAVPAPESASSEELRWVIEAALAAHNWTVHQRGPGTMRAWVHSQGSGEHAVIEINYRPGVVDIRCVKQRVSRSRYDRWMQVLSSEIMKNVAQLGMGRGRPPG